MRFLNADGQIDTSISGINMFAYCGNNPVNRFDPSGKTPMDAINYAKNNPLPFFSATQPLPFVFWAIGYANAYEQPAITESHPFTQMKIDTDGITPGGKDKYGKYHQTETSILNGVLDAEINHYVVKPGGYTGAAKLGDLAVVIDHGTGKRIYAIIADTGPTGAIPGEVSISVCWDLGYPSNGFYGPTGDFELIFLPGTATPWVKDTGSLNAQIDQIGRLYYP